MSEGVAGSRDLLSRARALESEGSYADVVRLLEPVARETLLAEPELGYRLAYVWRRTGSSADALRLCTDLDLPVRRGAAEWLIRRRLNLEAMLRFDKAPSLFRAEVLAQPKNRWIVVDEVQRVPRLLDEVHVLMEQHGYKKFALTGSSARKLRRGAANLLATFEKLLDFHVRTGATAISWPRKK